MASTAYRRGAGFENRVKDDMEDTGYYVVRSAGSQGVADLVALDMLLPAARPLMIQCKLDTKTMSVDAWNRFLDVATLCGAVPLMVLEDPKPLRYYSFMEVTGSRLPRSPAKPWRPWCLDAGRDAPALDAGRDAPALDAVLDHPVGCLCNDPYPCGREGDGPVCVDVRCPVGRIHTGPCPAWPDPDQH